MFLGVNHAFSGESTPILYETMIFAPDDILHRLLELSEQDDRSIFAKMFGALDIQRRYATKAEAIEGHQQMCNFVEVCLANNLLPTEH